MYPTYVSKFPELGFYGLPGHTRTPRDVIGQVQQAEALGVGNVMISERADYKEIAAVCGACAAVTQSIYIGTSATNLNTRHPAVTASMGSTLNRLSEGRFALGLAKGASQRWRAWGLPYPTYEREAEFVALLRRLWRGESVHDHDGALGHYKSLSLAPYVNEDIPILYVGFGPRSLRQAGRVYDGVHLHTFMGERALRDALDHVRRGEADAGREPHSVKVWSVLATACDVTEEVYLKYIVARLGTYLQIPGYGDMLVRINGWDPDDLARFRSHRAVASVGGLIDSVATTDQLAAIDKLIPAHWRPAAIGNATACAQRMVEEFDAGVDGIILHASTPEEFAPVLAEYEQLRPDERLANRTNRPA